MNNGNRYDTVGLKFAETLVDVSFDAQEKTAELRKAYLKAFQEGQKTTFDLTFAWLKQMQQLQTLSFDYLQDLVALTLRPCRSWGKCRMKFGTMSRKVSTTK